MKGSLLALFFLLCASQPSFAKDLHYDFFALELLPSSSKFERSSKRLPAQQKLILSAKIDESLSSENFGVIHFILENKSDQWMMLQNIAIESFDPKQNEYLEVLHGPKFTVWKNSERTLRDSRGKSGGGSFISSSYGNSTSYLYIQDNDAKAQSLTLKNLNKFHNRPKRLKKFRASLPKEHLLKQRILLPPGLFDEKWIVLTSSKHKKIGYVKIFKLTFVLNGKKQTLYLQFRDKDSKGWQESIPERNR